MKSVTISESEYLRLIQTIEELRAEIQSLKSRFVKSEEKIRPASTYPGSPIKRLRGVIRLPPDFDHKDFLSDELLSTYFSK